MRHLAVIPARSGSQGLKDKNIKPLNAQPLLAYSIQAAEESGMFAKIMVSTDSEKYAEIAKQYGAEVPFLRSAKMSCDTADSWSVVCEVLQQYDLRKERFDTVCLLQPTSPLRSPQDIINGYKLLADTKGDAITAVCEADHSPLWCNTLPDDLSMKDFIKDDIKNRPRQSLPQFYRINGALYIRKIYYDRENLFSDDKEYAYIMEQNHSIDIDSDFDFRTAEFMMKYLSKE